MRPGAQDPGSRPRPRRGPASGLLRDLLLPPEFHRERQPHVADWIEGAFEPTALVIVIGCFAIGLVGFIQSWDSTWDSRFAVPLAVVVAIVGFLYARRLSRSPFIPKEWLALLVPIALALRLLMLLPDAGGGPIAAIDLTDPGSFFTLAYIANLVVLLIAWGMALDATLKLNAIRVRRGEKPQPVQSAQRDDLYDNSWRLIDHATPLHQLAGRLLWGGLALVTMAGLTAINLRESFSVEALVQLVTFGRPAAALTLSNVLIYFVVSLLLIAEAQLARQRTSWQLAGLAQPPVLAGRWVAQACGITLVLLLVALALPTNIVGAVLLVLGIVATGVSWFTIALMGLFYLLIAILSWPLRLLNLTGAPTTSSPQPPPPMEVTPQAATPDWLLAAQTILIWLALAVVVAFALRALWGHRAGLRQVGVIAFTRAMLVLLGQALLRLLRTGRRAAAWALSVLPTRRRTDATPRPRLARRLRILGSGPRARIEYYFLSIVQRAASLGVPLARGETAEEFSARLPQHAPEVNPDLDALTTAFIAARYGPREARDQDAERARLSWAAVRARLRARRQIR